VADVNVPPAAPSDDADNSWDLPPLQGMLTTMEIEPAELALGDVSLHGDELVYNSLQINPPSLLGLIVSGKMANMLTF